MKVAIMQPYVFPYIGYFQLIQAVDKFVFYDDVNFIKGGWIHRNKLLVNGEDYLFTVPLKNQSSFKKINEITLNKIVYNKWLDKYLKTLKQSYSKAPYFDDIVLLVENVLKKNFETISELAIFSIEQVLLYLSIQKELQTSSINFSGLVTFDRTERLIKITKELNCKEYINTIGGEKLYSKKDFAKKNIELKFIKTESTSYPQFGNEFLPNLSIIDILMFNSKEEVKVMLDKYTLT